jgi:preprotein translocase SecF subunit
MRRILPKKPYLQIVKHKYIWYGISAVIIVVSVVALFTRGLNFGVDFKGGTELDVKVKPGTTVDQMRASATKQGLSGAQIQSGKEFFIVRVPKLTADKQDALEQQFKTDENGQVVQARNVGPGWGAQISRQAIIGLIVFLIAVVLYISLRFEFKMAVTAIIELVHDIIITVGVYALSGRQVTPATVIALLTIIGYSLYDTVIIFDRIKENEESLTRQSKRTYSEMVNDSVNQVITRSINTSLMTIIPITAILIWGGETLGAFAFALFVGIVSGTYSSIILAPPILASWKETEPKYQAYRERVERRQAREARGEPEPPESVKAKGTTPAARKAGAKTPAAKKASQGRQPAAKAPAAKKPQVPKPKAAEGAEEGAVGATAAVAPKPKSKPKPAGQKQVTSKSAAKSRTKGPGSGSKKKKKKR